MVETLKILGQLTPAANSLTGLYAVPISVSASVSSIIICNQHSDVEIAFRVAVALNGAVDDPKQYLYYDLPLSSNDTFIATIGISLSAGDIVRVQADNTNVSFNLFGVELS